MCQIANVEVVVIQGYIKENNYVPGTTFADTDISHYWIGVNLEGNWRLMDPSCGAGLCAFTVDSLSLLINSFALSI